MGERVTINLTPYQARVIWGFLGPGGEPREGGLQETEANALQSVLDQLANQYAKWGRAAKQGGQNG